MECYNENKYQKFKMVIDDYYRYEAFVKGFMRQFPVIKMDQFDLIIANQFDEDINDIRHVKWALQSNNTIIVSTDNWVMTPGMYKSLTRKYELNFSWSYNTKASPKAPNVQEFINQYDLLSTVNCLWLVADMLPYAVNITNAYHPFNISFITEPETIDGVDIPSRLYQIVYIAKNAKAHLAQLASIKDDFRFGVFKENIRRFALVEDEDDISLVPHVGFTRICKVNHKLPEHFEVVEVRSGDDIWKDAEK